MTRLYALVCREYSSFFRTPLGWVVVSLFIFFSSLVFITKSLIPGHPATMQDFFSLCWATLLFIAPAISMRLLSEEQRTGTIEPLLCAPVGEATIIFGKYLAGVLMLLTMLLPTSLYAIVLCSLARPDFGPILSGYLGIILLGMLYLAVGTLASSLTNSQTVAFLTTFFALLLLDFAPSRFGTLLPNPWNTIVLSIPPSGRTADFFRGLIDSSNIIFFLALSAWFLALAWIILQSRRWR